MNGKELIKFIKKNKLEGKELALNLILEAKSDDLSVTVHKNKAIIHTAEEALENKTMVMLEEIKDIDPKDPRTKLEYLISAVDKISKEKIKSLLIEIEESYLPRVDIPNFQMLDKEETEELMKDNNIIYKGGVVGIEYYFEKYEDSKGEATIVFLIEDDGNLFRTDFELGSSWLDDIIRVCSEAKKILKKEKE